MKPTIVFSTISGKKKRHVSPWSATTSSTPSPHETGSRIFNWVLSEIAEAGDLYIYTVLVDGIYIKADADNKKVVRKEIVIKVGKE